MGNCCYKGSNQKQRREQLAERARLQALEQQEWQTLVAVRTREENVAASVLTTLCRAYINCPRYGRHEWMHQGPADGSRYRHLGVKRKINFAAQAMGEQLMLGYAIRCRYERAVYSAIYIQRVERGRQIRHYYSILNAMATRIQCAWRGMHWRQMMAMLKVNLAASALQHAARVHMAKLELLQRRREQAAITIQWFWRRRAKMRIWMAIRYNRAAARIQGGFRAMKYHRAPRKAAYMASRRKVKEFMERIKLDRHFNTLERLRISYEELVTLKRYNVAGFRSDSALGAKTKGAAKNRGMHIHGYDATALARHIKAEAALYEKSQATKRKWAIMRAKPAAATRIARTYRGHMVRRRRRDEFLAKPAHGELLKLLRSCGLGRRVAYFEKLRIPMGLVQRALENDGAQLGGEEDPELWEWEWKKVATSKSGKIPWGLTDDERAKLLGKLRLKERMRLAKQALADQRRREAEEAAQKKKEEEERREERRKEMEAHAERQKREAEIKAEEARQAALHQLRWREREREEAERLAAEKEAKLKKVQGLVTRQEEGRRAAEAQVRDAEGEANRRREEERAAAAAKEEAAKSARVRAVTALRAGRSVRLRSKEVVATALAATATSGRVLYAEDEVEEGWPQKIRHALESGVVSEIDAADQTVLMRLPVDSAAAQATKEAAGETGSGRSREIWYPVEAVDTAAAEAETAAREEATRLAASRGEPGRQAERQRLRDQAEQGPPDQDGSLSVLLLEDGVAAAQEESVADWTEHCTRLRRTARGLVGLDFKLLEAVRCLEEAVAIAEGFGLLEERARCLEELAVLHRQRTDLPPETKEAKVAACEQDARALRARLRLKGVRVVLGPDEDLAADATAGGAAKKTRQRGVAMESFLSTLKEKDVSNAPAALPPRRPTTAGRRSRSRSPNRSRIALGATTLGERRRQEEAELAEAEMIVGLAIADAHQRTAMSGRPSVSAPNATDGGGLLPEVRPRSVGGESTLALLDAIRPEPGLVDLFDAPVATSPRNLAPVDPRGIGSGRRSGRREGWRGDAVPAASPAIHAAHLRTLEGAHSFGGPPPNDKERGLQLMAVQDMDGQTGQVDAKKLNLPPPVVLRRESAAVQ
eukprot:COSAG04_NODE_368_length_15757_cov_6.049176_6_plen_1109_part_00